MAKTRSDYVQNDIVNKALATERLGIGELSGRLGLLRASLATLRPSIAPFKRPVQAWYLNKKTGEWDYKDEMIRVELRQFGIPYCEEEALKIGDEIYDIKQQIAEIYLKSKHCEYKEDMRRGRKALMEDL
jgi:hypothetical protein